MTLELSLSSCCSLDIFNIGLSEPEFEAILEAVMQSHHESRPNAYVLKDALRRIREETYKLHPDIETEEQLGKYLVENHYTAIQEELKPYLDYERIAYDYSNNWYQTGEGYIELLEQGEID